MRKYGNGADQVNRAELSDLYERHGAESLVYLWAWCIRCPYCKQRFPLLNHGWIVNTDLKKIALNITPNVDSDFTVNLIENAHEHQGRVFSQKAGKAICLKCRNSIDYDSISKDITKYRDSALIAVVTKQSIGKGYELPTDADIATFERASDRLTKEWQGFEKEGLIPNDRIRAGTSARKPPVALWNNPTVSVLQF